MLMYLLHLRAMKSLLPPKSSTSNVTKDMSGESLWLGPLKGLTNLRQLFWSYQKKIRNYAFGEVKTYQKFIN